MTSESIRTAGSQWLEFRERMIGPLTPHERELLFAFQSYLLTLAGLEEPLPTATATTP